MPCSLLRVLPRQHKLKKRKERKDNVQNWDQNP